MVSTLVNNTSWVSLRWDELEAIAEDVGSDGVSSSSSDDEDWEEGFAISWGRVEKFRRKQATLKRKDDVSPSPSDIVFSGHGLDNVRGRIQRVRLPVAARRINLSEDHHLFMAERTEEASLEYVQAFVRAEPCKNLVRWYAGGSGPGHMWAVCEYMELGSLQGLRAKLGGKPVPPHLLASMAQQSAAGLLHLHSRALSHGDLCPKHILINRLGQVKLKDHGICTGMSLNGALQDTGFYVSPERTLGREGAGPPDDVWSLGMIIHELAIGHILYHGVLCFPRLFEMLLAEPEPRLDPSLLPEPLCEFCAGCLVRSADAEIIELCKSIKVTGVPPEVASQHEPAWILVQTLTGERLFGPRGVRPSPQCSELVKLVEAEHKRPGNLHLVHQDRVLMPGDIVTGGEEDAPLTLTAVYMCRASCEQLLQYPFCTEGVASQMELAQWVSETKAA